MLKKTISRLQKSRNYAEISKIAEIVWMPRNSAEMIRKVPFQNKEIICIVLNSISNKETLFQTAERTFQKRVRKKCQNLKI